MITEVRFLDVFTAKALAPGSSGAMAIISVLDAQEEEHRPSFEGFAAGQVLRLQFSDVVYALSEELEAAAPSMAHAQAIHEFILVQHALPHPVELVAHCFGGVSRSVAIAIHAGEVTGVPLNQLQGASAALGDHANGRLLSMLRSLAGGPVHIPPTMDWSCEYSFISAERV